LKQVAEAAGVRVNEEVRSAAAAAARAELEAEAAAVRVAEGAREANKEEVEEVWAGAATHTGRERGGATG
jgi:hypothetical protein